MGNVAPPDAVVVTTLHCVPEHVSLRIQPGSAQIVLGQLAGLTALRVDALFKTIHRDLTEDGGNSVVNTPHHQAET